MGIKMRKPREDQPPGVFVVIASRSAHRRGNLYRSVDIIAQLLIQSHCQLDPQFFCYI